MSGSLASGGSRLPICSPRRAPQPLLGQFCFTTCPQSVQPTHPAARWALRLNDDAQSVQPTHPAARWALRLNDDAQSVQPTHRTDVPRAVRSDGGADDGGGVQPDRTEHLFVLFGSRESGACRSGKRLLTLPIYRLRIAEFRPGPLMATVVDFFAMSSDQSNSRRGDRKRTNVNRAVARIWWAAKPPIGDNCGSVAPEYRSRPSGRLSRPAGDDQLVFPPPGDDGSPRHGCSGSGRMRTCRGRTDGVVSSRAGCNPAWRHGVAHALGVVRTARRPAGPCAPASTGDLQCDDRTDPSNPDKSHFGPGQRRALGRG